MTEVCFSFPRAPGQNPVPLPRWQGQGLEEDDAPVLAELTTNVCERLPWGSLCGVAFMGTHVTAGACYCHHSTDKENQTRVKSTFPRGN